MIALYLIASHMVGDFIFQNRWHSARKFDSPRERAWHVLWYTAAFVPVAVAYAHPLDGHAWRSPGGEAWGALSFLGLLAVLHYATDSRRYLSTLGDVLGWKLRREFAYERASWTLARPKRKTMPDPNPWPAMPLMIDQTLHVVQVAVLAGLFLR